MSLPHVPLDEFCDTYIEQYPEFAQMPLEFRDQYMRLLSVFMVGNDVVDVSITLSMSVKEKQGVNASKRSFKPIDVCIENSTESSNESNEISVGQQNLDKQIQNLSGSELSMPYIKDADGAIQFKILAHLMNQRKINLVELGGGRGETNAVPKALQELGSSIRLLNVEPHAPFATPYIKAHQAVGIENVQVLQKEAQFLSTADVKTYFNNEKADALFASHSFYFLLGDLHKATQEQMYASTPLVQHPLWKYFEMLKEDGTFVITMQTGGGARLFRNALLEDHGLSLKASDIVDDTNTLLKSFGNIATFLRHFEVFAERYQKETGKILNVKMHYAVANVPLGDFAITRDLETGGYILHEADITYKMFDFYGNWKELQTLATLTFEKAQEMSIEQQKKLGVLGLDQECFLEKRRKAQRMQETFLHILPVFALAGKNMQHPNITLEIMATTMK